MARNIVKFQAPAWASSLNSVPSSMIKLSMTPTPIAEWKLPGAPSNFQVFIKRDDLTGSSLTGNKVRKLEFILCDVLQKSCSHVITAGSLQSNHCRAVAAACAELGLQSHLFLRTTATNLSDVKYDGNLLLNKLVGAQIHLIPRYSQYEVDIKPRMQELARKIKDETGEKSYLVPIGGSDIVGVWGYLNCFEEIRQQGVEFDDLVCVCGSGGTAAGLSIANYLNGSPYKCHAILVSDNPDYFHKHINECLDVLEMEDVRSEQLVTLYSDYKQPGYGANLPHQLNFIAQTAEQTGILLDNVYTGKGAYGLSDMLQKKPEVFKGRRVLFVHSGGAPSLQSSEVTDALLPFSTKSRTTLCPA